MVDFGKKFSKEVVSNAELGAIDINNLVNSTNPPEFILKLLIIQKREDFHSALDQYTKQKALGQVGDMSKLRARLMSLFFQLRASIYNHYNEVLKKPEVFKQIEQDIRTSKDFETLYKRSCEIEDFLYQKKVIKFDNEKNFAPEDIEGRNKAYGYF
jgi:hypothetical protein